MKYLVGISGGKDSTAALLWVIHESGYSPEDVIVQFISTGIEAQITLNYIDYLSAYIEQRGYAPVIWLKPPMDFFELAKYKRRFPSPLARFCAVELKVKPLQAFISGLRDDVVSISGIRALESKDRAELPERATDEAGYQIYRPLLNWTLNDVWVYLRKWSIERNPLYDLGFQRVGCFPCCMSRKDEIRLIATHFPEVIDKIREQEELLGSSFFRRYKVPAPFRRTLFTNKSKAYMCGSIDDVVEWSFTKRGGKQFKMFFDLPFPSNQRMQPTPQGVRRG